MSNTTYTLKVSPQGQVTLPRQLREQLRVQPGSRIVVTVEGGSMRMSGKLPITKHFGAMPNLWTAKGQDAADYSRKLRDGMQPEV